MYLTLREGFLSISTRSPGGAEDAEDANARLRRALEAYGTHADDSAPAVKDMVLGASWGDLWMSPPWRGRAGYCASAAARMFDDLRGNEELQLRAGPQGLYPGSSAVTCC